MCQYAQMITFCLVVASQASAQETQGFSLPNNTAAPRPIAGTGNPETASSAAERTEATDKTNGQLAGAVDRGGVDRSLDALYEKYVTRVEEATTDNSQIGPSANTAGRPNVGAEADKLFDALLAIPENEASPLLGLVNSKGETGTILSKARGILNSSQPESETADNSETRVNWEHFDGNHEESRVVIDAWVKLHTAQTARQAAAKADVATAREQIHQQVQRLHHENELSVLNTQLQATQERIAELKKKLAAADPKPGQSASPGTESGGSEPNSANPTQPAAGSAAQSESSDQNATQ